MARLKYRFYFIHAAASVSLVRLRHQQELWEEVAICHYLAEELNFVPSSYESSTPIQRARFMALYESWKELRERCIVVTGMRTPDECRAPLLAVIKNLHLPNTLKTQEKVLQQGGGPYHYGDKVSFTILLIMVVKLEHIASHTDHPPRPHGVKYPPRNRHNLWPRQRDKKLSFCSASQARAPCSSRNQGLR